MSSLTLSRRAILFLPLAATACAGDTPDEPPPAPVSFEPLRYDYLNPIPLNVAAIEIADRFVPSAADLGLASPEPPVNALRQMAQDRFQALGSGGRAVFVIKDASLTQRSGNYVGTFTVELDVYTSDNTRAGFAEATVSRTHSVDSTPRKAALYDMTKTLMEAMNVEVEYQVRQSLKDWIISAPVPAASPVEQQNLAPPS